MPDEVLFYLIVPVSMQDPFMAIPSGRPGVLTGSTAHEIFSKMEAETKSRLGPFAPKGPSWILYDPTLHGPVTQILSM